MEHTSRQRFLVLMTTTRCNLSCSYCYVSATEKGRDMPLDIARRAVRTFLPDHGRLAVQFSGGEPLLAFDLIKKIVLNYRTGSIRFAVQTNGLLLDSEKLLFFVKHGVGLGLSLDGIPEVNEQQRGATKRVIRALDLLDELGIGVNVTTVLTNKSAARLPEFLLFCARHRSIDTINLDLLRPAGRAPGAELAPQSEQLKNIVPIMMRTLSFINRRRRSPVKVRELEQAFGTIHSTQEKPYCLSVFGEYAVVMPDGDVYPCPSLIERSEYLAGNLRDFRQGSLAELTSSWGTPSECRRCKALSICRCGCPARRIGFNGTPRRKNDADCALWRSIYQSVVNDAHAVDTRTAYERIVFRAGNGLLTGKGGDPIA